VTARDLFNAEGTGHQSALDIATALGISAGHLYYHFRGKPQILAELLAEHGAEVDLVLEAMLGAEPSLESLWTHVHILAEEAWDARFFWREPALAMGNPQLAALAQSLLTRKRLALGTMLQSLEAAGVIAAGPEVLDGLARQLVTGIAFHAIALELEGDPGPPRELIARAAAQIMLPVAGLAV
jgi:AcrR family transcriptional regulator